ncbi:MAG: SIS domain-containing protein [Chloroflexi bacterium]|nr:SIS domain-containing protein [Chloroflexota bacterium]
MSQLLAEIHEQPGVLRRLLAAERAHVREIAARVRAYDPRYAVIAARGTSDNAARYAQYVLGAHNRLSAVLSTPSLFTRYHSPPRMDGALVIGISQSGASPDLLAVLAEGKRQGCRTLTLTNVPDSPLAAIADDVLALHAGEERSIAATKTFTAQLLAVAMLSPALSGDEARLAELERVPEWAAQALAALAGPDNAAVRAARHLAHADHCVVIGRGYNYATAHETAIKSKELALLAAEPYSAADFLHGPIALIEHGFPVVVINMSGQVAAEMDDLLVELWRRGAQPVVISDRAESLALAAAPIPVPAGIPEWLSPIVAIIAGQLLAYHLTFARGYDPDRPRGIQKVTLTT